MWLTDLQIVLTDRVIPHGAIQIEGNQIVTVYEGDAPPMAAQPAINATGLTALPGAISFALAEDDVAAQEKAEQTIATINAMRPDLLVDFQVHARLEVGNPKSAPILARMINAGEVQLVSVMDHTPGQGHGVNAFSKVNPL